MNIWAIADLHLAFGVPQKSMEVFGPEWSGYTQQIEQHWRASVAVDDLVLVAGDISWAMALEHAKIDLDWIDALPGTKVLIKGNHDHWWGSLAKLKPILPPSLHLIQNNAFVYHDVAVAGARLWDTPEYNFQGYINFKPNPVASEIEQEAPDAEKIFKRELERFELSLKALPNAPIRLAMTHYPPISADLQPSRASALLEKYNISHCVFGHLHNVIPKPPFFGSARGVNYHLTSCDFLRFQPLKLLSL